MKLSPMHAACLAAISLLAACSKTPETTVDWYVAHKDERIAKVAECQRSAELAATPDCINANKAKDLVLVNKNGPSASETFKFNPNKVLGTSSEKREQ